MGFEGERAGEGKRHLWGGGKSKQDLKLSSQKVLITIETSANI
jgi:hypothetical protein